MELVTEFRSRSFPVDVIVVSAAHDGKTLQHMLRYGIMDYIIKPFKFNRFQAALENYRQHRLLQSKEAVVQDEIDRVSGLYRALAAADLPKNLNQVTLNQIKDELGRSDRGLTADEVADQIGIARVTARRYLDYLEKEGVISKEIQYGSVARPVHRFQKI